VERLGHQLGTNVVRSRPVEFTHRTVGPSVPYKIAVTEHGETTMRWNRSRCAPIACATTALIGSACDTATTTAPGWARTRPSTAVTMRVCISANDSPPGNRNPLG